MREREVEVNLALTLMYSFELGSHCTLATSSTRGWWFKLSTSGSWWRWSICGRFIFRPSLGKNSWHILSLSFQLASLSVPSTSRTTIHRSCRMYTHASQKNFSTLIKAIHVCMLLYYGSTGGCYYGDTSPYFVFFMLRCFSEDKGIVNGLR